MGLKGEMLPIGERIRMERERKGWNIDDLVERTGYPESILQSVEENKIVPPVGLIIQISRALRLDIDENDIDQEKISSHDRVKSHKKRIASYAYKTLTKGHAGNHLRSYLVTIAAGERHKGVEYRHEGEEFIYVLKGGLLVEVGGEITKLSKGGSILFNSDLYHKLSNPTKKTAELIVTIYIP